MLVKYPACNCRLILGLLKYAVTTVQVIAYGIGGEALILRINRTSLGFFQDSSQAFFWTLGKQWKLCFDFVHGIAVINLQQRLSHLDFLVYCSKLLPRLNRDWYSHIHTFCVRGKGLGFLF